jgi:hypothetical protein
MKHYTLTLSGAAQRLSDCFGSGAGVVDPAKDIPFREIMLSSLKANAADIFVGGDNATVTSTSHAFRIDPGDTAPPITLGGHDSGGYKLSSIYVLGTASDVLCIGGNPF